MICIKQFQIHNTQSNTKNLKECPNISTEETEDEHVHQPLCIDYPNVTSVIRELSAMIRLQRIYNFWLLHAILSTVLDIIGLYYPLLYYFWD